jgi:hypothetical protein
MASVSIPGNPFEIYSYNVSPTVKRKALRYNGADVYLGGIYAPTLKLDGGYEAMMQFLSQNENNFFRHWMISYHLLDPNQSKPGNPPEPFRKRYCPFAYDGAARQWNLLAYNDADNDPQSYFARLRSMLSVARKYNIIVQLMIFDATGMRGNPADAADSAKRWPWSPWNNKNNKQPFIDGDASAFPTFYETETRAEMRQAQVNFARRVVERTVEYWNVVYEIMNEPGGPGDDANLTLRAKWADEMVGVINGITKGRRLIFYNDFHNGKDVNMWKALDLPNYEALDGVTFHGDPNLVNPDGNTAWKFREDKVIQASSDGYDDVIREKRDWNRIAANHLFDQKVIFQAEAVSPYAADGVKRAAKGPTTIRRAPFLGNWDKTSTQGPDFFLNFGANGRYVAVDAPNDKVLTRGRLVSYTDTNFVVEPEGQAQITYAYTLSGDTLSYYPVTDATRVQTFKRFSGPMVLLEPFLYWWEKVGQNPGTTRPLFNLYFRPDSTFAARALDTGAFLVQGTLLSINDNLGQIVLRNNDLQRDETWSYRFYNAGQSLRLTNAAADHYAIYERRA